MKRYEKVLSEIEEELYGINIFYPGAEGELPLGKRLYEFFNEASLDDMGYRPEELTQGLLSMIKRLILRTNQYVVWEDISAYLYERIYDFFLELEGWRSGGVDQPDGVKNLHFNFQSDIITYLSKNEEIRAMDQGRRHLDPIPCSQYSGQHQLDILSLQLDGLKEPILDIGSGYDGSLVAYLRSQGLEAYGMDRMVRDSDYLFASSWLDHDFEKEAWGTIISHMAFSNHFKREHLKLHGRHLEYAQKYMEILGALKKGGSFYYSPSLDFIEDLLPEEEYELYRRPVESAYLKAGQAIFSTRIVKKFTYL